MATAQWSNLPSDILSIIAKFNNSDADLLLLRSVCSSWRSSLLLPSRKQKISFPLILPPTSKPPGISSGAISFVINDSLGYYTLNQSTFYRLSPPSTAGDMSRSWLFKASQSVNPNTFSLLVTLLASKRQRLPPGTVPDRLNLLDYGISEICTSYSADFVIPPWAANLNSISPYYVIKKVIALWNFVTDCEFAVLALRCDFRLSYWKFGDPDWTPIDSGEYRFTDVILWNGKCYAVYDRGFMVSFDSEWNLTVVASDMPCNYIIRQNYLVGYGSDLYLVSKISLGIKLSDDLSKVVTFQLMLTKFNESNGRWDYIVDAGDLVFILCDDGSLCVSAKDYGGCKGNTVYLTDGSFVGYLGNVDRTGVYHLGVKRAFPLPLAVDFGSISWPPPTWLRYTANSSE